MAELDTTRYIMLTTFKRDGTAVSSPVWITGSDGTYAFTTGERASKARRLRHNPAVQVQVCGMFGRIKPGATLYVGTGEVLTTTEAVHATEAALLAKYGWRFRGITIADRLTSTFGRKDDEGVAAIRLLLSPADPE
jgi:uncharacterized protein